MDSDSKSEHELISLITKLVSIYIAYYSEPKIISVIAQIISLVSSMDLDPKSELISLTAQTISLFNSMDLDSQPKPFSKLISLVSQKLSILNSTDSDLESDEDSEFVSLLGETSSLEPEPKIISLIHQIFSLVISMNSDWRKLISLCPQVQAKLVKGKFLVAQGKVPSNNKFECLPRNWHNFRLTGEDATNHAFGLDDGGTHFFCQNCKGKYHKEHEQAPLEVKHYLHPKHSLQLALSFDGTRKCFCCDDLIGIFYYCSACDFAMNIACVEKQPIFAIDRPKWHDHDLLLFPRQAYLTCNLCALADSSSPIYMCPPCDFVAHLRCINLPRVIRISRHTHRIFFTPYFGEGDWSCGVCRRDIESDYGGYSCIEKDCVYAAHSRCATQKNVWDKIDLEGIPEYVEEDEVEPFVKISDGVIQHFSHQHHHLRLDENAEREYDDNKECQACITPIYYGNLYSCMQCDFILHEACANHPRGLYHPIHPHPLTLFGGDDNVVEDNEECSACYLLHTAGFFYECGKRGCHFKVHMQCGTISEPLLNESHMHPLYLTSKPEDERSCHMCKFPMVYRTNETFNCIKCDFSLCFGCAILPQKVRYKHDKHMVTLCYGEEISTLTYWCEACEKKLDPTQKFYRCDEYCCVTLHIDCTIGKDRYMKPGSTFHYLDLEISVRRNNKMSRPYCTTCKERCPFKIFLLFLGNIYCSVACCIRST